MGIVDLVGNVPVGLNVIHDLLGGLYPPVVLLCVWRHFVFEMGGHGEIRVEGRAPRGVALVVDNPADDILRLSGAIDRNSTGADVGEVVAPINGGIVEVGPDLRSSGWLVRVNSFVVGVDELGVTEKQDEGGGKSPVIVGVLDLALDGRSRRAGLRGCPHLRVDAPEGLPVSQSIGVGQKSRRGDDQKITPVGACQA